MSTEIKKEIQLEITHVFFMDIVGSSKMLINEQRALRVHLMKLSVALRNFGARKQPAD